MKNAVLDVKTALDGFPYEPHPEQLRFMVADITGRVHSLETIKKAVEALRISRKCRCLNHP